jgi:hypothetical protein
MKTPRWQYVGHCVDGERFVIENVNVWDYKWQETNDPKAMVEDPQYHQPFSFEVYEIEANGNRIRFAAGEYSNCIWGFYREA